MSNYPAQLDSDASLPRIDNNIVELGGDAINALRDAMFAVEGTLGINPQGSQGSVANFLSVSFNPDGTIKPSSLLGIGLIALPITDSQISPTAGIQESKLALAFSTTSLFNLFTALKASVDVLDGFLTLSGVKLEPHISGVNYNHLLSHIHIDTSQPFVKTNSLPSVQSAGTNVINRNTTNADTLLEDINTDLVAHEKADGTSGVVAASGGTVPPQNYAHNASGIFVNPNSFSTIPQTNNDLQKVVEFFDSSSLLLLGSRTQNLYANGIPRTSRSSILTADGYGELLIPPTPVVAYLLNVPPGPQATSPVDDINHGDDIILFQPTTQQLSTFNFDAEFAQVKAGDLLTINYGNGVSVQFTIDSTKSIIVGQNRTYAVRIVGKNFFSSINGTAQINRPLFHRSKWGVLSTARCPNSLNTLESLIIAHPRAAIALGNGFNPSEFDATHYNIYLTLFATGDPSNPLQLPAIDITGNKGTTPGQYTLDSIITAANTAFRAPGFNYRFIAFQYNGQFGIMLADPYNNASFSVVSGSVDTNGNYTSTSLSSFPNNVVDNFNGIDPIGFGLSGANVASPPFSGSYQSVNAAALAPTLIFTPLTKSFFYTNGVERDRLKSDPIIIDQSLDSFGDGYWNATILPPPSTQVFPNRVEVVYQINLDLSTSGLAIGKTIVIQPTLLLTDSRFNFRDYGRFIIKNVVFNGCGTSNPQTNITVYDGVHAAGVSPAPTSTNIPVRVYFADDSVGFDSENVFDLSANTSYKRFFEVYVNQAGHTFTHERARFINTGSDISNINIYRVSPKLRGYPTNNDKEIRLVLSTFNATTGIFTGQLSRSTGANLGPLTTGKQGEVVRFYDETNIDYIDFIFDLNPNPAIIGWTPPSKTLDIQLFPSLELDEEMMLISSCQINDLTKQVSYLKDERQFGNTSEEQFTSSALDFIAAPQRLLRENGIITGFDINSQPSTGQISINGGTALINGKVVNVNNTIATIPVLLEALSPTFGTTVNTITWFVCANDRGEIEFVASTDYSPSLSATYGSLDHTRLFYVKNPNSPSTNAYVVRSTFLSDLVLNRKDLALIAIVSATTTVIFSTSTYVVSSSSITDARRFVSGGYNGLTDPFVLSPNGNFRSFTALNSWLTQLLNQISASNNANSIGKTVIVKGQNTISSAFSINYAHPVVFTGDDGTFILLGARAFNLNSNITFDNVRFNYDYNPVGDGTYNSSNLVNSANAVLYCNVSANTGNKDIVIKNCEFNATLPDHYPFISFEYTTTSGFVENVQIKNNRFNSVVSGTEDPRASIAFIDKNTSGATSTLGTRLTSCEIVENISNKNHLLIISADHANDTHIKNAITPVGVLIANNICGAIGILVRQDTTESFVTGSSIKDKENGITIRNNTCQYIATLDSFGVFQDNNLANIDIITGSVLVRDNVCAWIHITTNSSSSGVDRRNIVSLTGNKLNALPSSILTTYTDGYSIAIRVEPNANTFTPCEAIIANNSIDFGFTVAADLTTTTTNSYVAGIECGDAAIINGNIIKGIADQASVSPPGSWGMILTGSQNHCTVISNKFIRGTNNLTSYIDNTFGNGNHIITNNFFDQTTSNNTGGSVTTNFTTASIIERNKNQTAYVAIAWTDNQTLFNYDTSSASSPTQAFIQRTVSGSNLQVLNITDNFAVGSIANTTVNHQNTPNGYGNYISIVDSSSTAQYRHISHSVNLNSYIPLGAKIVDVRMGVWVSNLTAGAFDFTTSNGNYFSVSLERMLAVPFSNVLDLRTNILAGNSTGIDTSVSPNPVFNAIYINSSGDQATFTGATQYANLDTTNYSSSDVSENFRINANYNIVLTMEFQFKAVSPNTNPLNFWLSPALVQYVW